MKFALLTNQVRAARRPPLLVPTVTGADFSRLFPGLAKTASPSPAAPKHAHPVAPLNGKGATVRQAPLEIFSAASRGAPAEYSSSNGKQQHAPQQKEGPASVSPSVSGPNKQALRPRPEEQRLENGSLPAGITQGAGPSQPIAMRALGSKPDHLHDTRSALSLHRMLKKHPDLPDQSILLGVCEDGLPVALDLFDHRPGGLLAIGDERDRQIELLRNAIDSAATRNSPRALQFLFISHQPQVWQNWVNERGFQKHCLAVVGADDENVGEWILRLADWTEQRRLGQVSGPPVLLVMDTLSFLPRLSYDVRLNFGWMIKEGPPAQIWPLAAISTDLAASLGIHMLRWFKSRILGCSKNPQVYANLFSLSAGELSCFSQPGQFGVQVGDRWIYFRQPA